jgi:hypothetical protein
LWGKETYPLYFEIKQHKLKNHLQVTSIQLWKGKICTMPRYSGPFNTLIMFTTTISVISIYNTNSQKKKLLHFIYQLTGETFIFQIITPLTTMHRLIVTTQACAA